MKKDLLMACAIVVMATVAHGLTGTANGYAWDFDLLHDGTANITGCSPEPSGHLNIPEAIVYKAINGVLQSVAVSVLGHGNSVSRSSDFPNLTSVHIPGCVKTIDGWFTSCANLSTVDFDNGVEWIDSGAFADCHALKSIDLPPSVKYVGVSTFGGCPITNLAIRGHCYVRGSAFPSCELESVHFSDDVVFSWDFGLDVANPDLIDRTSIPGVTLLDGYMIPCRINKDPVKWRFSKKLDLSPARGFSGNCFYIATLYDEDCNPDVVEEIVLSERMLNLPPEAFLGLENLKRVEFGSNSRLKHIYQMAFSCCSSLKELRIPSGVETVDYGQFGGSGIEKLTFPSSLKTLSLNAFRGYPDPDGGIAQIVFDGDAPDLVYDQGDDRGEHWIWASADAENKSLFNDVSSNCVVQVKSGSSGWGAIIPGTWHGLRIEYIKEGDIEDDVLPVVPDEATVADTLSAFIDASIAKNIKTVGQYDSLRTWVHGVKSPTDEAGSTPMVKASPYAWLSFALGADRLIDKDIVPEDVRIVSFDAGSGDAKGALSFEVAIDGVEIGGGQVAMETFKANLKKVLGVEGAARLDKEAFSSDGIELSIGEPVDGKARFTVQAPKNVGDAYFMRVTIRQ